MRSEKVLDPVRPSIAIVCVSLRGGGTEKIVSRIASRLSDAFQVLIVTLAPAEPFFPLDSRISVCSPDMSGLARRRPRRALAQLRHLYQRVREFRPELTLVFGEDITAAGCLTARLAGARNVLVFFRGTPARSLRGLNGLINPLVCRLARRVIVQTRDSKRQLSQRYSEESLVMIPNPIEVPDTVPMLDQRERVILSVGSLGRKKNQGALIRAFATLPNDHGWRLVFVGDGPDRTKLEELAATLGVGGEVEFLGERDDVEIHLFAARIFAFTSLSEGFPNALAEALAAGCACISNDCPTGPSELIENGVNGLLVPNGDEAAFRDALQKLIEDPALQRRLSEAARECISQYDADLILERFESLVREWLPTTVLNRSP